MSPVAGSPPKPALGEPSQALHVLVHNGGGSQVLGARAEGKPAVGIDQG